MAWPKGWHTGLIPDEVPTGWAPGTTRNAGFGGPRPNQVPGIVIHCPPHPMTGFPSFSAP